MDWLRTLIGEYRTQIDAERARKIKQWFGDIDGAIMAKAVDDYIMAGHEWFNAGQFRASVDNVTRFQQTYDAGEWYYDQNGEEWQMMTDGPTEEEARAFMDSLQRCDVCNSLKDAAGKCWVCWSRGEFAANWEEANEIVGEVAA